MPTPSASQRPPDIICICIDDLGATDLGCFGSSFYETPVLDRLCAQGLRYTDAYASCPVCSPTRASLLTGRYPARVGITQFIGGKPHGRLAHVPYLNHLPHSLTTVASALQAGGYATWHVGKWHLGGEGSLPTDHGFKVNVGGCHWGMPQKGYWAPWHIENLAPAAEGTYLTDHLTDQAVQLIRDRDRAQPFFLNLWHYAVHTPIQAPADLVEKYRAKAARLGLDRIPAIVQGEHFPCAHKRHQRMQRRILQSDPTYAAMIENLDTNIGRLLDGLVAHGDLDNTLIVFTSDNGGLATAEGSPTCNAPWFEGKGWAYEGGVRVTQFAHWPARITAGTTCHDPVTSTDLFPTFLAAAGLPLQPQDHCDGVSLEPTFSGQSVDRAAIFWHYPHYSNQGDSPCCAVRAGDWKLIEHFEDGKLELYDLANDPSESKDCAAQQSERVRELHRLLIAWRHEVSATLPAVNPDWRPETAALWDDATV